jgi:uncharacterized membrane protein (DUF4010 family)
MRQEYSAFKFHQDGLALSTAVYALTLAAITNTIVKAGIAAWQCGCGLASVLWPGTVVILIAGAMTFLLR